MRKRVLQTVLRTRLRKPLPRTGRNTPIDIFGALHNTPHLTGAKCIGHHQLFDPQHPTTTTITKAIQTCHQCPALTPCRDWYTQLPPNQKPPGITAGAYKPDHE